MEAYKNPFESIAEVDPVRASAPEVDVPAESNSENILDRHLQRIEALSTSSSPPSSSISSISSIRTSNKNDIQQAVHHRLDASVEGPPGLEGITIRINGLSDEPTFIMGRIVDSDALLGAMPMSITSSPVIKIDETEEVQIDGIVPNLVKYFDQGRNKYSEIIDSLGIGSDSDQPIDPEDLLFVLSKVEDNGIFPMSVPRDSIRRSKSRKKKLKRNLH